MARQLLKRLIRAGKRIKTRRNAGFTLIELLISIIIGALITVLLMGLVIDLAEANQRDASRSQVQQDMQAAIDYMVQDLREAVFVYNGQCLEGGSATVGSATVSCPGIINHIPEALSQNGSTPVLAFWRTEPLPSGIAKYCSDNTDADLLNPGVDNTMETDNLVGVCVAAKTYSLVVYSLDTNEDGVWQGQARLTRYRLTRFPDNATGASQDRNLKEYVDPFNEPSATFQQWPLDSDGNPLQTVRPTLAQGDRQVLLDFVSASFVTEAGAVVTPDCKEFVSNSFETKENQITPKTGNRSFYACVRGGGLGAASGQNQDVLLSLVGNVTGKPGYSRVGPQVAPIQTRVLVRGVIAK